MEKILYPALGEQKGAFATGKAAADYVDFFHDVLK